MPPPRTQNTFFIDLHKQFILEQTFPHILSIVLEIGPKGKKKHEFCQLSEKGILKVIACNQEEFTKDQNVNKFLTKPVPTQDSLNL